MGSGAEAVSAVWIPGAVSATFRKTPLDADGVIALLLKCGLKAVEWSENTHVFPSDASGAALLRKKTEAAGLRVAAYGSYYRLGENPDPESAFRRSLVSARALEAPVIRIWAGTKPSCEVTEEERESLTREAVLSARLAGEEGIKAAFEWHKNTLTDTNESAERLLKEAGHPNLYCLWQPTAALSMAGRTEGIRRMADRLLNFHVYSWPEGKRAPLDAAEWRTYFAAAESMAGEHCALLEFVKDDSPEQFRRDARTLIDLLERGLKNG